MTQRVRDRLFGFFLFRSPLVIKTLTTPFSYRSVFSLCTWLNYNTQDPPGTSSVNSRIEIILLDRILDSTTPTDLLTKKRNSRIYVALFLARGNMVNQDPLLLSHLNSIYIEVWVLVRTTRNCHDYTSTWHPNVEGWMIHQSTENTYSRCMVHHH